MNMWMKYSLPADEIARSLARREDDDQFPTVWGESEYVVPAADFAIGWLGDYE